MEKAKSNVEKYYQVVGITENMIMTLKVLEAKMPEYFAKASDEYFHNQEVKAFRHKNPYKFPVSKKVKEMLIEKFKHEYEFYRFCKEKLEQQYQQLF